MPTSICNALFAGSETVALAAGSTVGGLTVAAGISRVEINTAISTAGAGTLTGAAVIGGVITRTGPAAAYTDTFDTAALLFAALPTGSPVGASWKMTIKNTLPFAQTLAGVTNVTLSGVTIIPPNSVGVFLVTYSASTPAFTVVGLGASPLTTAPLITTTALTTAGAGTITAANVVGGFTIRTGPTAAFTDTFDTTANIIAALPNANIGQSVVYTIENRSAWTGTLAAGDGSTTLAGITIVPPLSWVEMVVVYSAASTVTITGVASGPVCALPNAQFTTAALSTTTAAAGQLSGSQFVCMNNSGATPGTYTSRTAALMVTDIPNCVAGLTYICRIVNGQGTGTLTFAGGSSVTVTGTATIAINTWRDFLVTINTITGSGSITFQNLATGTFS